MRGTKYVCVIDGCGKNVPVPEGVLPQTTSSPRDPSSLPPFVARVSFGGEHRRLFLTPIKPEQYPPTTLTSPKKEKRVVDKKESRVGVIPS